MRFRKGDKVEVFTRRDVPSGCWWCGAIVSRDGHSYVVRYDDSTVGNGEMATERVPRTAVRPCPPVVEGPDKGVCGDIVEVFDGCSWKIAQLLKVVGSGRFLLVRLLGSSREFRVCKSNVRARLSWVMNDQWVAIGKDTINEHDIAKNHSPGRDSYKRSSQVLLPDTGLKALAADDLWQDKNIGQQKLHRISSGSMKKRLHICTPYAKAHGGACGKRRAIEKGGSCQRLLEHQSPFLEKVDAVASPFLGEKYMHASFNNRMTGFFEINPERGKTNADDRSLSPRSLEPNDCESSACSIGSCGSTNVPYILPCYPVTDPVEDSESHCYDTESSSCQDSGEKCSFPAQEHFTTEIHRLESHAYCSTMEALYASGPLSWEQEAMLTNLRLMLHISNDEHLLVLRHLVVIQQIDPTLLNLSWVPALSPAIIITVTAIFLPVHYLFAELHCNLYLMGDTIRYFHSALVFFICILHVVVLLEL
ncbi:hypothetical protein ACLOJK_031943 [Asimina triloba]